MSSASVEDAVEEWRERILDGSMTLADGTHAEDLAEEFGDVDDEWASDLCDEAVMIAIQNGRSKIPMEDFVQAAEKLEGNGDQEEDVDEETGDAGASDSSSPNAIPDGAAEVEDEDDPATDQKPAETTDSDETHQTEADSETDDQPEANAGRVEELEAEVEDLQADVRELNGLVQALRRQVKEQAKLLVGGNTVQEVIDDVDGAVDHRTRLQELDDRVTEHDQQITMVRVDGGGDADSPDDRARRIRQTLYNKAKQNSNGKAEMTRSDVDSRLGGGLHRDSVLDAMKRTADGYEAESEDRHYTPISGSSDLEPVDSVTFGLGKHDQSKVVMNLSDATGAEVRQNLTTQNSEEEG